MRPRDRHSRRRSRPAFRPAAEGLEPRIALSAAIGVNIGGDAGYAGQPIWTDLHNLASAWTSASASSHFLISRS